MHNNLFKNYGFFCSFVLKCRISIGYGLHREEKDCIFCIGEGVGI